ncbi:hypothetical protein ABB37_08909 [Leptomonas pyrrhocoris]|uniref:Uncharacterized protein n=1 Tax=Leptomonas pyrrhocoris TaxID=157538 RepID=A0A0M9FSF2_LEPPY|nr:hypothetical protein ABB37_08909 [Leptomonas pyrrhocoris]KPA74916.1 hypothetical protein ABB37_08909 [Leptomonas pyrrhocoris]|eukprot:XP_015653355.1 hypothetical protein ABB37_08909 [Leptomonas pyrrhocoris]
MSSLSNPGGPIAGHPATGTPSPRKGSRTSATVQWSGPLPPMSASSSRGVCVDGVEWPGGEGPTFSTSAPPATAQSAVGGVAATGHTRAAVPTPTVPKRPGVFNAAFSAAAAAATGVAWRQHPSSDTTAVGGCGGVPADSSAVRGAAVAVVAAPRPRTSEDEVDVQQQGSTAATPPTLPPPPPPPPSMSTTHNTNGVCEAIVSGVRHAAGGSSLWGPTTGGNNAPLALSPPPHNNTSTSPDGGSPPHTPSPPTSMSAGGAEDGARAKTAEGRRSSGRYVGAVLPEYTTPGESASENALLLCEKRMSDPFASYSVEMLVRDVCGQHGGGAADGGGDVVTLPHVTDDGPITGELTPYPPQQQGQLQLHHQRSTMDCNDDLQRLLEDAHQAYAQAEARLLDDGLSLIEDWMRTRDLFFSAGSLFAAVGDATTAARCLLHATFINRAFHSDGEALTTLSMSVEQLKHAHPRVAVESLLRLVPCYANKNLRYQTARCYRDAAELLETELEEKAAAVELYRAALAVYADTQVAAKALSRKWQKQQQQQRQQPTQHSFTTAIADSFSNLALQTTMSITEEDMKSLLPSSNVDVTVMNMQAGLPPPHYQVSTTVQRSLVEACRGRLLVLLAQLHRYAEVMEVALTCADAVPRSLPRTKFLLCATLSVLARGAPPPSKTGDGEEEGGGIDAASAEEVTPPAGTVPAFMSAAAEAADALYFDSLYDTAKVFSSLQEEDRAFQRGKENELVRALLEANKACSLSMYDEAVRTYNGYATTERSVVLDVLIEQCRRCLFQHVERFA